MGWGGLEATYHAIEDLELQVQAWGKEWIGEASRELCIYDMYILYIYIYKYMYARINKYVQYVCIYIYRLDAISHFVSCTCSCFTYIQDSPWSDVSFDLV